MESINCIICHNNETRLLVNKDSYNVVKCKICGLVYLNPRLDEKELSSLYDIENNIPGELNERVSKGHDLHKIKKFRLALSLIKKYKKSVGKIFDLGCSTGIFMGLAAEEGWIPFGCDLNSSLVKLNRKLYGDNVKLQKGMNIDFPERHFDVVTLFDSIEHMPDPISALQEASRILKDDGMIVVSTPNVDGLFPKLTYWLLAKTIGAWEHPTPPGHVFQFSRKTLSKALNKAGFEVSDSTSFEIYLPYTVGEMENSIIKKLRGSDAEVPVKGYENAVGEQEEKNKMSESRSTSPRLPRLIVRAFCRTMACIIYPIARVFGAGDSIIVIARKKP